jgi:starch-binding outer membrane protein, SusD/RagB family
MNMKKILLPGLLILLLGCEGFLDQKPADLIRAEDVVKDAASAEKALLGVYFNLMDASLYSLFYIVMNGALSDEFINSTVVSTDYNPWYLNNILPTDGFASIPYTALYRVIYSANFVAEQTEKAAIAADVKSQYMAEARVVRALCYLILVQCYGNVAMPTGTVAAVNNALAKAKVADVLQFAISDLESAKKNLPLIITPSANSRIRVGQSAANALLARLYQQAQDWAKAAEMAGLVIADPFYKLETDLNRTVASSSTETIFELTTSATPGSASKPGFVSQYFSPTPASTFFYAPVSPRMVAAFEPGDKRFGAYIAKNAAGVFYVNKYRTFSFTSPDRPKIFRLPEMYLIRAEALARQNNLVGAAADVNVVRNRAGLGTLVFADAAQALLAVEQERFVEHCFEGHRWVDLARTGRATAVLGTLAYKNWQPTDVLLPIPQSEIDLNPNLLPQNDGY